MIKRQMREFSLFCILTVSNIVINSLVLGLLDYSVRQQHICTTHWALLSLDLLHPLIRYRDKTSRMRRNNSRNLLSMSIVYFDPLSIHVKCRLCVCVFFCNGKTLWRRAALQRFIYSQLSQQKKLRGGSGGSPGVLFHFLRFGSPLSWEQRA